MSTTSDPIRLDPHWQHWRAASYFDSRPWGLYRRWYDHEDTRHSCCQSMFRCFTSNPERSAISVTSCLADFGSCSDCQQGGLLQLSPRWYIVPAARPAAVRIECRRPSGFLLKAVRTHNPIAPWAPLAESSGAGHLPAMRSGIPLPSWNSAVLPCCELSPDIWRRHSPPSAFCGLSHAGRTFYQTYNARRPCLSSGFRTCMEQFAVIRQEWAVADDVPSWSEDCTFSVVVRFSLGDLVSTVSTVQLLSACGHRLSALLPVLFR